MSGPEVTLTNERPAARFLVRVHAFDRGPNRARSTDEADALIEGSVASETTGTRAPFVKVRVAEGTAIAGEELDILTQFGLAHALSFSGDCSEPAVSANCEARFVVEFERAATQGSGDHSTLEWSLKFSARAYKGESPSETLEPPWSVEVVSL